MLPDKALEEFQEIYEKEYGIVLSRGDARKLAEN